MAERIMRISEFMQVASVAGLPFYKRIKCGSRPGKAMRIKQVVFHETLASWRGGNNAMIVAVSKKTDRVGRGTGYAMVDFLEELKSQDVIAQAVYTNAAVAAERTLGGASVVIPIPAPHMFVVNDMTMMLFTLLGGYSFGASVEIYFDEVPHNPLLAK